MTLRQQLRNRQGMALMFTLVTFLVVFLILTGVAIVADANLKSAQTSQKYTATYYTAESGINTVSSDIRNMMNQLLTDKATIEQVQAHLVTYIATNNNRRLAWNPINGQSATSDLKLSMTENGSGDYTISIESVGAIGTSTRRLTMALNVRYNPGGHPIFKVTNAITALGSIVIGNQSRIAAAVYDPITNIRLPDDQFVAGGPIATYSRESCAISIGGRNATKAPPLSSIILPPKNTTQTLDAYKASIVCALRNDPLTALVGTPPNTGTKAITDNGDLTPYPNLDIPVRPTTTTKLPATILNGATLIAANGNFTKTSSHTNQVYMMPEGTYYVPQLSFDGTGSFTFHVTGKSAIVTDKLAIRGTVTFTGDVDSELTIYVKGNEGSTFTSDTANVEFTNGVSAGWPGTPEKLKVVIYRTIVSGRDLVVTLSNNLQFHGSILLENANLILKQNANLIGYAGTMGNSIVFNENTINHDGFFYGPNAVVFIDQNCGLVGAIAVKTVTIGNNGFVHFDPTYLRKFPFMILGTTPGGGGEVVDPGGDPTVNISEGTIREGN